MPKLPANINLDDYKHHIKPIDNDNPDYYQWGLNTRLTYGDLEIETKFLDEAISPDKRDMFWEGYLYGIENIINNVVVFPT